MNILVICLSCLVGMLFGKKLIIKVLIIGRIKSRLSMVKRGDKLVG